MQILNQSEIQKTFSDKNVNEKVDTFNKTILNLLSNFIPNETITCVVEIHHGLIMKSNPLYTKKYSIEKVLLR